MPGVNQKALLILLWALLFLIKFWYKFKSYQCMKEEIELIVFLAQKSSLQVKV